mgnify:CR=1 FL=1
MVAAIFGLGALVFAIVGSFGGREEAHAVHRPLVAAAGPGDVDPADADAGEHATEELLRLALRGLGTSR